MIHLKKGKILAAVTLSCTMALTGLTGCGTHTNTTPTSAESTTVAEKTTEKETTVGTTEAKTTEEVTTAEKGTESTTGKEDDLHGMDLLTVEKKEELQEKLEKYFATSEKFYKNEIDEAELKNTLDYVSASTIALIEEEHEVFQHMADGMESQEDTYQIVRVFYQSTEEVFCYISTGEETLYYHVMQLEYKDSWQIQGDLFSLQNTGEDDAWNLMAEQVLDRLKHLEPQLFAETEEDRKIAAEVFYKHIMEVVLTESMAGSLTQEQLETLVTIEEEQNFHKWGYMIYQGLLPEDVILFRPVFNQDNVVGISEEVVTMIKDYIATHENRAVVAYRRDGVWNFSDAG